MDNTKSYKTVFTTIKSPIETGNSSNTTLLFLNICTSNNSNILLIQHKIVGSWTSNNSNILLIQCKIIGSWTSNTSNILLIQRKIVGSWTSTLQVSTVCSESTQCFTILTRMKS